MGSEENGTTATATARRRPVADRASSARPQGRQLASRASDAAGSVRDTVRDAPSTVRQQAEGNPLAAGAVAFAAGFFVASLLKPTDREQQLSQQAKERLEPFRQKAVETGRQVVDDLKQTAQEGLQQVRSTAQTVVIDEALNTAKEITTRARDEVSEVKEEAKSSAKTVKAEAKRSASTVKTRAKNEAKKPSASTGSRSTGTRTRKPPSRTSAAAR